MRVSGAEEPSTEQHRSSYLLSPLSSTGAKVTSRGTSIPGQIYPFAGVMESSAGKFSVFQKNLENQNAQRIHIFFATITKNNQNFSFYTYLAPMSPVFTMTVLFLL